MIMKYLVKQLVVWEGNERKKFLELENKILSKEIEGIWFYDWDRMVREVDVMIYFRNLVEESGCKVFQI